MADGAPGGDPGDVHHHVHRGRRPTDGVVDLGGERGDLVVVGDVERTVSGHRCAEGTRVGDRLGEPLGVAVGQEELSAVGGQLECRRTTDSTRCAGKETSFARVALNHGRDPTDRVSRRRGSRRPTRSTTTTVRGPRRRARCRDWRPRRPCRRTGWRPSWRPGFAPASARRRRSGVPFRLRLVLDDLDDLVDDRPHLLIEDLADLGIGAAGRIAGRHDRVVVRVDEGGTADHALGERGRGLVGAARGEVVGQLLEFLHGLGEHLREHRVLGVEVEVEARSGHAGTVADGADGQLRERLFAQQLVHGVEDGLTLPVTAASAGLTGGGFSGHRVQPLHRRHARSKLDMRQVGRTG